MTPRSYPLAAALLLAFGSAQASPPLQGSRQIIVVTSENWDSTVGQLQAYERSSDRAAWRPHGQGFAVALGRSGSAWGLGLHPAQDDGPQKQEGDGRNPAGVFAIGPAFGYAATIDSPLPYQPMQITSYCMDVTDSPYYNRIVDAAVVGTEAVAGSTEPMRLDLHDNGDQRYREGFVIRHNPDNQRGHGSCIFAHLWRNADRTPATAATTAATAASTAGCTAMAAPQMSQLLAWLQPGAQPRFVQLPRVQYQRLQRAWSLPILAGDTP